MLNKISHVCLGASDLTKTIDFYCSKLKLNIAHRFKTEDGELYGVFIDAGDGTFIEFFKESKTNKKSGLLRHICFEVEDIYALKQHLNQEGFLIEISTGKTDGILQCWITDPDGNKIEFQQR